MVNARMSVILRSLGAEFVFTVAGGWAARPCASNLGATSLKTPLAATALAAARFRALRRLMAPTLLSLMRAILLW
jgi:hypothetical protein